MIKFNEEPTNCPHCNESFSEIQEHNHTDSENPNRVDSYECNTCGFEFTVYYNEFQFKVWKVGKP